MCGNTHFGGVLAHNLAVDAFHVKVVEYVRGSEAADARAQRFIGLHLERRQDGLGLAGEFDAAVRGADEVGQALVRLRLTNCAKNNQSNKHINHSHARTLLAAFVQKRVQRLRQLALASTEHVLETGVEQVPNGGRGSHQQIVNEDLQLAGSRWGVEMLLLAGRQRRCHGKDVERLIEIGLVQSE